MSGVHLGTLPLVSSDCLYCICCLYSSANILRLFFSRYTLAGVNAVKEVQVTRDMTDCTEKNGPL